MTGSNVFSRPGRLVLLAVLLLSPLTVLSQPEDYVWETAGGNSSESMPCGGGDIGLNVWTEQGDVVMYVCRSGSFDENNTLLKAGKLRLRVEDAKAQHSYRQTLHLNDGMMTLACKNHTVTIWVDVNKPIVHVEVDAPHPIQAHMSYESWREHDHAVGRQEAQQCSYKWTAPKDLVTTADTIRHTPDYVEFYHENSAVTVFDKTVAQQGLQTVSTTLYNPLNHLISGGRLRGMTDKATRHHHFQLTLCNKQGSYEEWEQALSATEHEVRLKRDRQATRQWWNAFWQRSWIRCGGEARELSRNYTLFRYMLGCNAHSQWPTKFNGGLFTFDPKWVDSKSDFTPDYRRWGGGTHTAQNQRLVYWPLLASGDYDLMLPQFDFYNRLLATAETRSRIYWGHEGACFVEQLENFGLPNPAEYGSKRREGFDPGLEYNAWLEYEWDTVLEFCQMILLAHDYGGIDIDRYLPMVKSCLRFFDEHYRYLAMRRGNKALDGNGKIVIYPGSACETYKMAYNPSSTIAALRTVTETYMQLVDTTGMTAWRDRIPPLPLRNIDGHTMIAPAVVWERVNNVETPQLYAVFPWRIYGVGRDSIDIALNTYLYDPDALRFRSSEGWKQDNIWAACLGLTDEARRLTKEKLSNGPYRFPAFWGPGFDWSPDHNWGGSGMIGLQEMLLQEVGDTIVLFPAWPREWDVSFKLHASKQTTVEVDYRDGEIKKMVVNPSREVVVWKAP